MSTLFAFIGVLSTTITFDFAMFILRPIRLLSSDSSCLVASVVVIAVFLCIGICHQQSGEWR